MSAQNEPRRRRDLVECRASASYPQQPLALYWQGERLEVANLLNSWRSPDSLHFEVQTADKRLFLLRYVVAPDAWHVEALFE